MAISDASLGGGMAKFLALGLGKYAVHLDEDERECVVYECLFDLAAQPLPPEDKTTLGNDEGSVLAKWWDRVACAPPKKTEGPASSLQWKEAKNLDNFIRWGRLCQTHREDVAGRRAPLLLQSKACLDRSLRGAMAYRSRKMNNTVCFKLTMHHILDTELTSDQRRNPKY